MSADVVAFKPREIEEPHLAGEAECTACGHRWAAVAPVGTVHLDCPACDRLQGKMPRIGHSKRLYWRTFISVSWFSGLRLSDVLSMLLQGKPNKDIARRLGLSVETVKDHVQAVLRALGVSSRTQAVLAVGQMTQQRQQGRS